MVVADAADDGEGAVLCVAAAAAAAAFVETHAATSPGGLAARTWDAAACAGDLRILLQAHAVACTTH